MKTIGLLGGMSFESTIEYYRIINDLVNKRLGRLHSAKSIMYSVDFEEIEQYQREDNWDEAGEVLSDAAKKLEIAGADFLVLCTNTMHKVSDRIQESTQIPLLHIADATAEIVVAEGIKKVGLLGTKYTMEQDFYKGRLIREYELDVIVPEKEDIDTINRIIFEELVLGVIKDESKSEYLEIMDKLTKKGAKGIILGCTEIGLLIKSGDTKVPLFDTAYIHAEKAVGLALD